MDDTELMRPHWHVREWRKSFRLSQEALADRAGMTKSMISEFETRNRRLNDDHIAALCAAMGITPEEMLRGPLKPDEISKLSGNQSSQPPAMSRAPDVVLSARTNIVHLPILGQVAAGQWMDIDLYSGDHETYPAQVSPEFPQEAQYLLRVHGTSINRQAASGALVRCLDLYAAPRDPHHGDWVVVERVRPDGMIETTVKRLVIRRDGVKELHPDSDDPRFQSPIPLESADGDIVRVKAFVLDFIRPATKL